jgi:hypothetical protein
MTKEIEEGPEPDARVSGGTVNGYAATNQR